MGGQVLCLPDEEFEIDATVGGKISCFIIIGSRARGGSRGACELSNGCLKRVGGAPRVPPAIVGEVEGREGLHPGL